MRTVERQETGIQLLLTIFLVASLHQFVTFGNQCLGISQILGGQLALNAYQLLNQWLIFLEHLVVALGDRTRDDKRCTGIVDQHRIDLIDDGVVMCALYQVGWRNGHVVAQIVETELVVSTEGDIGLISLAALL